MEVEKIGTQPLALLALGAALSFAVPVLVAVIWKIKKKEPITSILAGAATFLLFALILEKPIQAVLLVSDNSVSAFLNAKPVLWALAAGLFPGVFEETGRFIAFRTVLRKRKNKETAISHGIGHGGFEAMYILGASYITYIAYALMLNSGTFSTLVEQVKASAPGQLDALYETMNQIAAFSPGILGAGLMERVFAVLFHTGASILVFYACRDRKKFMLYPLAVVLHTALDFIPGLAAVKVFNPSTAVLECIVAAFGILTFAFAYFLFYRKDKYTDREINNEGEIEVAGTGARLLYQGHASLRITSADGKVIYIDPYAGEGYEPAADLILITHAHSDHTNTSLIKSRNPGCSVITYKEALEGGAHKSFDFGFVSVEAVEAGYNPNHYVKECVGYILTFSGGVSVYVSGDTSTTEQMPRLAAANIDYAFFCCDGIYNMDLDEASHCASLVGAKHSIPYHMAPGRLFDRERAERFTAEGRIIIAPGEEIGLI